MLQEWLQKNLVPCGTKYFKKKLSVFRNFVVLVDEGQNAKGGDCHRRQKDPFDVQ